MNIVDLISILEEIVNERGPEIVVMVEMGLGVGAIEIEHVYHDRANDIVIIEPIYEN